MNCEVQHDRDGNAAKNIEMVGVGHRYDLKRAKCSEQRNYSSTDLLQKRKQSPRLSSMGRARVRF